MALYGLAKDSWSTILEWPTKADKPYRFGGTVFALLAVVSLYTQKRPSDLLSETFFALGLESIAGWFGGNSPPAIRYINPEAQEVVMRLGVLILVLHILAVVRRGWPDLRISLHDGKESFGARSLSTIWILMALATQLGAPQSIATFLKSRVIWAIAVISVVFVLVLLLWLSLRVLIPEVGQLILRLFWLVLIGCVSGVLALLAVPLGGLLLFVLWATSTEAKWATETQASIENEHAEKISRAGQARLQTNM